MKKWVSSFAWTLLLISKEENTRYLESLYPHWGQSFRIDEIIYKEKTAHQELILFKNAQFGVVLALDGAIQVTEKDEFVYHEMMVHTPLFSHGNVEKVLVVGGGDGGIIREIFRHDQVKKVVLVEIDAEVVKFSKKYLPFLSQGAFDDPRLQVVIEDGCEYVKKSKEKFDLIFCDSPDPIGPAEALFTQEFYENCRQLLNEKGLFINQCGVPFMQPEEMSSVNRHLKSTFRHVQFFLAPIPTYAGGMMAFGMACQDWKKPTLKELKKRYQPFKKELRYYTPAIHRAAFVLPKFISDLIKEKKK